MECVAHAERNAWGCAPPWRVPVLHFSLLFSDWEGGLLRVAVAALGAHLRKQVTVVVVGRKQM
jgi:hypothetical protein